MKILLLTASPVRDKLIDEMIAKYLIKMGHKVEIHPCLRGGRQKAVEYKPDVCVVPPVRNVFARDTCKVLKSWGVGVVTRHTEPSCDWQDFKAMTNRQKAEIMGHIPYYVDMELVWSSDEQQILSRRGTPFPVHAVGSFSADKYFSSELKKRFENRDKFNLRYGFKKKKTILIQSPWGFVDHAPDLRIDELVEFNADIAGRDRHLAMIEHLHNEIGSKFNILVTIHPGVLQEPYKEKLDKLGIPLDVKSTAMEMLINSDILIHAGSTVAMGAHFLNKPALQFGDVNLKDSDNWWHASGQVMASISPNFKTSEDLIEAVKKVKIKSNINKTALKKLETGRYGVMDGKATERAAKLINKVKGKFRMCWPDSSEDYSQLTILKHPTKIVNNAFCSICRKPFHVVKPEWIDMFRENLKNNGVEIPDDVMDKIKNPKYGTVCCHCGARFIKPT
jgi:hypothetical protein